ncbi:hypothetical protein HG264_04825 [Pseudomonas sp. gcc21]|uniref:hypothetical protein n=1 Tax=Pseudomonas sp. gcc21 TaxID=2726989 RepID=UPI001451B0AB|nr:hypothetical protein [Pseudomonas sp. gcc21]QJD58278.1 hypothetical protein HG264_04825 [Pseudomonas sp. gcc21]
MSSKILGLCLATAFAVAPLGITHAETHDHAHGHEAHQAHGMGEHAMQLNDGSQWETDAPLRKAMGILRNDIRPLMPEIHQDTLEGERYQALASSVTEQVSYMIEHCELEGEADAQLHLVIADLMTAAKVMQGEVADQAQRFGAIRMVGALNNYATYFDDAGFEKLSH